MRSLHVSQYVHWAEDTGGSVTLLNENTGQWHLLNPTAAFVWRMARDDQAEAAVITALRARFPEVPHERIRDDFEGLLGDLTIRGLIWVETGADVDTAWNETSMAFEGRDPGHLGAGRLAAAAVSLPIAVILSHMPFRWTAKLLRSAKSRLPLAEATTEEADALARAVERVAHVHLGRVACYENSLMILVAAVLSRRSVTMYLGTATDPRRFHAWIEACGQVVRMYPDPCPGEKYQPVIVL